MSENSAGPEDFLAGGETNLLRAMTRVSQRLYGTNAYAVVDSTPPEAIRAAALADSFEGAALRYVYLSDNADRFAKHCLETETWVELLTETPDG